MQRVGVALVMSIVATACGSVDRQKFAPDVERAVSEPPQWAGRGEDVKRRWAAVQAFYEGRRHVPAWIDGDDPTPQLDELLRALRGAEAHGLDPAAYGLAELEAARAKADEAWFGATFEHAAVPELDLRLTWAFLQYASDLLGRRTSPRDVDRNWVAAPKKVDLAAVLQSAVDDNRVEAALRDLAPAHAQYRGLQAALAGRRGAGPDDAEAERLRLNLERWRWAPRDLGERHIVVNVPAYRLQVVERDEPVVEMKVIVGAQETPTPLFSDNMAYVVFSPYWNIPESILREETLPRVATDPEYLLRNNIEVVGTTGEVVDAQTVDWEDEETVKALRFRQAPGPDNALGLVKFIFPNHFSVYLHDTNAPALFARGKRALSHGCVRVEKPVELAEYVLRDKTQWTADRITKAMNANEERTVHLEEPLPVHIGYWTAWVESGGSVTFTDDPYGLDLKHARAIQGTRRR